MKQFLCAVLMAVMLTALLMSPVSAAPYNEQELEEYMAAIYCEPVWGENFESFEVFFLDVDFDGRQEIIGVETGEKTAPKRAQVYAFMDMELSGRGELLIGELFVCRDSKTGESLIVNRMTEDGKEICQYMVYDNKQELLSLKDMSKKQEARLEDYGWHPVVITKEQTDTVEVYEDSRAIFFPAYNGVVYDNGQPPVVDPTKADSVSTYLGYDSAHISPLVIVLVLVGAALLATGIVVFAKKRGKKGGKK